MRAAMTTALQTLRGRERPLVAIMGCTGTGKSDLAIRLALRYQGEVVNADAMQIYKGLDIATNKVTDMNGVVHHLLGELEPSVSGYNVHRFRCEALERIEQIWSRGRIPFLVGGTAYYAESIIYRDNLVDNHDHRAINDDLERFDQFAAMSDEQLYRILEEVDPESAKQVHIRNRTRVLRALMIFRDGGKRKSEILAAQHATAGGDLGGGLRFANTVIISLDAEKEILDRRLDQRVDAMLERGLREEIEQFYQLYGSRFDGHGIWQAIAVKEFLSWLRLDVDQRDSEEGEKIFAKCCELMKLRTRQYVRRQRNWMKQRLVARATRETAPIVTIDTSSGDLDRMTDEADAVLSSWLQGESRFANRDSGDRTIVDREYQRNANLISRCAVCEIDVHGLRQYELHLRGKRHMARVIAVRKKEGRSDVQAGQRE